MRLRAPRPRLLAVLLAAVAGLLLPSGVARSAPAASTDKGVVQEVTTTSIVLRGLDGSSLTLALGPFTVVRLNGKRATPADLRPGLVAEVTHTGDRPARLVRAFGAVRLVEEGILASVSRQELVVRRGDGTLATIALGPGTEVRRQGRRVRRSALKPGFVVRVTYAPGSPARLVVLFRRAG